MKYGKMIDVFVFQDIHGSKVLVDFVLKIQTLMLNKQIVFVNKLMNIIALSKIYVYFVHSLLTSMERHVSIAHKTLFIMLQHNNVNVIQDTKL